MYLVTGGAGFFGETLLKRLLKTGNKVKCLDLNVPHFNHENLITLQGDVRDKNLVIEALKDVEIVHHNVAQVPVAKNKKLFWEVNFGATKLILEEAFEQKIKKFVYTSSSAVFGVPVKNPVTEYDIPSPMEEYGKAKYEAEKICNKYSKLGMSCSIVRPRTILGNGRLGIFQILFEWIYQNKNVPVIGNGNNLYQFIHSDDLTEICFLAGENPKSEVYNAGAKEFGTMKQALENLISSVNSKSKVCGVNRKLAQVGMDISSKLGLSPLGKYHSLMYGNSMYFDNNELEDKLNYRTKFSNDEMFLSSYNWYLKNRSLILSGKFTGSKHQSFLKQKILKYVPFFLR